MKRIFLVFVFLQTGCSTVMESLTDSGHDTHYVAEPAEGGGTKYVSRKIIPPSYPSDYDHEYGRRRRHHSYFNSEPPGNTPAEDIAAIASLVDLVAISVSSPSTSFAQSNPAPAITVEKTPSLDDFGSGFGVGFLAASELAQIELTYNWLWDYVDASVGVAYFGSDRDYFGFNGGLRAHMPWDFSPFAGIGVYGGDSKTCTRNNIGYGYQEEICEKYFLLTGTLDLGLQWKVDDDVQLRAFARQFDRVRQQDNLDGTLYGLSVTALF